MGISDIIPGVSGSTIAVLLGIYESFIQSINGLVSREWKRHLPFLIPLAIGAGSAILLFSHVIEMLFANYPKQTQFFFVGLILGVLPYLFKEANVKEQFTANHYIFLCFGALLCISLIFLNPTTNETVLTIDSFGSYSFLFFSGILASSAMILPGISGSFIMYVLGVYHTVIAALTNFSMPILIVMALGIITGFLLMSKIISYFLNHFRTQTLATVIGLVIGSVFVVFPGFPQTISLALFCIISFTLGLLIAYLLGKIEYK